MSSIDAQADRDFRDLRIDIFRGTCLLIIFIDHVPYNKLASFTLQRFAFIDCADIFVFISGYVSGLAFTRTLLRDGLAACFRRAWRRCGELYLAHILISGLTLALFYEFALKHVSVLYDVEPTVLLPYHNIYTFVEHPASMLTNILLLRDMPYLFSILPMFVVFTGVAPFLAWGLRRHGVILFLILIGLYVAAQCTRGFNFHLYPGHIPWYMSVFAWQLVFALGFLLGNRRVRGLESICWVRRSYLIFAAIGLITIAVIRVGSSSLLLARFLHTRLLLDGLSFQIPFTGKFTAEPLRLANLLMMVMLFGWLDPRNRLWKHRFFKPLINCGQNSLVVFGVGIVLSAVANCAVLHSGSRWLPVFLSLGGCLLLIAAGHTVQRMRQCAKIALTLPSQIPASR